MELAHRLSRQHHGGIEPRLALEGGAQLAQRRVLAHAADEPRRDLVARFVVEVARRLRRQHDAEACRAGSLQEALQRLGGGRLGVGGNVEVGLVEHHDRLQLVVGVALAEAQRLRQELRDPEEDVLVVAEEAGVDDGKPRAPVAAAVAPAAEQRLHAQRLAAGLEQRRVAVPQTVELGHQIAADAARRVHALREVAELRILLLEQIDEVRERHLLAEASAQDAQRHRQRARLLLVRGGVLEVQHVAERCRGEVGEQLLLLIGQLVDAVGQERDRDRPARGAARRVDGNVDGVS